MGNIWNTLFVQPILNLLVAFYKLFEWLHVPGPLGFVVIGLTIVIRLILYPLMNAQLRSAKKMAKIKPHLDALNEKHKNDKQALQQAQMNLYKEHGINPAAGCLPLLIQMPVLIALYNVFYQVLNNGNLTKVITHINEVVYMPSLHIKTLDLTFFGVNLGIKPSQWQTHGWWLLVVPLLTAALQWYQSRLMMNATMSAQLASKNSIASAKETGKKQQKTLAKKEEKKEEKSPEDSAMEMQKQMAMITPVMFGYFALQFPLGLALYWNVFGLFGIIQQLAINREA